jgi:hypothetical protein
LGGKMTEEIEKNRRRLFAVDAGLREEADRMLEESGIGKILREEGFVPVGSYAMRTMTWRDLDFERTDEQPDWQRHWELGTKLAKLKWVWRLAAVNAYHDPRNTDEGHYWGLRVSRPGDKNFWKLDLWTARREEFERGAPKRPLWESRLNDDTRNDILVIKEAVCGWPEYRDSLLSVHVYEAVLENGVRGVEEFREWWRKKHSK